VLQRAVGLSSAELLAIAELEREVVKADGGRLKLEWGTLRSRNGKQVEDLLWWEGDRLLGLLGMYNFGPATEMAGMVAPAARRRGIATALLDAGLDLCRDQKRHQALLVVPRSSSGGRELALRRQGTLDHSEHALVLSADPSGGASDPRVSLRRALPADAAVVSRLIEAGFGHAPSGLDETLGSEAEPTLLIELSGEPVGTVRVSRTADEAGVYGFVIDPTHQGQGIGRDVLRRVCQELRADGARRVGLEVAVGNDRALGLYTSLGFTPVTTEDYYALPVL
jgi:ribosomal protein S18 acetylase RimI-like enzyme